MKTANTTNIVDDAGTAAASYTYSDSGETTANNIAAGDGTMGDTENFYNEVCYTGGIYDENTGEYYLNARYYDPADGRFTTQDSYRGENTDEGTWNLYAYCAGDPVNHTDLSGHVSNHLIDENKSIKKKYGKRRRTFALRLKDFDSFMTAKIIFRIGYTLWRKKISGRYIKTFKKTYKKEYCGYKWKIKNNTIQGKMGEEKCEECYGYMQT